MEVRNVDIAIIGSGTAGLNARHEAERAGKSYVMIEEGPYGTTCARVGCMPSKLLIAAAETAHQVSQAATFGIDVPHYEVNGREVMERVRRMRNRFVGGVLETIDGLAPDVRLRGHARFVGPTRLRVGDDLDVEFGAAVVATGSKPWIPPQLADVQDDVLVNDDVFEFDDLPDSLAIFGTGIIALELGQAFARLGVRVEFFNPFIEIGFLQDPEVQKVTRAVFEDELDLTIGVDITSVTHEGDCFVVRWVEDDVEHHRKFSKVLAAAGRRPNLAGLDLEAAGIEVDEIGHPVGWDPHTARIGESALFLAGDATGYRPILHEASDEGRIAGANAARFPDIQSGHRRIPIGIAFTQPNMAFVGTRFNDLDPADTVAGEAHFETNGRARILNENRGIVRLYANRDCKFLGAEIFAPAGEHLAHLLAWTAQSGLRMQDMLGMPFYHPTIEEALRGAIRHVGKKLAIEGRCPPEDRGTGPGA